MALWSGGLGMGVVSLGLVFLGLLDREFCDTAVDELGCHSQHQGSGNAADSRIPKSESGVTACQQADEEAGGKADESTQEHEEFGGK